MPSGGITPNRVNRIVFDTPETVTFEEADATARSCWDIQPAGTAPPVQQLSSGGWISTPDQDHLDVIAEAGDPAGSIVRANRWQLHPDIKEEPVTPSPYAIANALPAESNHFLHKDRSDPNWDNSPNLAADQASFPHPPFDSENIQMDRLGVTADAFVEDEAFLIRVQIPATQQTVPDQVAGFAFGGPRTGTSLGQFYLALKGDGIAQIFFQVQTKTGGKVWYKVNEFRYSEPHRVAGNSHSIRILPHMGRGRAYIDIRAGLNEAAWPAPTGPYNPAGPSALFTLIEFLTIIAELGIAGYIVSTLTGVTGHGPLRLDGRRDTRFRVQVAELTYPAITEWDDKVVEVRYPTRRSNLTVWWMATVPPGTAPNAASIDIRLYDAITHMELTPVANGAFWRTYQCNIGQPHYYAHIIQAASLNRRQSTILWEYRVTRDGWVDYNSSVQIVGAKLGRVTIGGQDRDITHETASAVVDDKKNELQVIRQSSGRSVQIETRDDDGNLISIPFCGYTHHNPTDGMGVAGRLYPSPQWGRMDLTMVGMWQRLQEARLPTGLQFHEIGIGNVGQTGPLGNKITDTLRVVISYAGFTYDQIDIPDIDIRWDPMVLDIGPGHVFAVQPYASIGDFVFETIADYLTGYWLIWDRNAGSAGKWRLVGATLPNADGSYDAIWTFRRGAPAGKNPVAPGAYPDATIVIEYGTWRQWANKPEFNSVRVLGLAPGKKSVVSQQVWNPKAGDFFSDPDTGLPVHTADPNHPDYTNGHLRTLLICDPGIQGATIELAQAKVNRIARRYYDVTCHAQQMFSWQSPYVLLPPDHSRDPLQTLRRSLRYYDPVLVEHPGGTMMPCLITSVQASWDKDRLQRCTYEAMAAVPLNAEGAVIES